MPSLRIDLDQAPGTTTTKDPADLQQLEGLDHLLQLQYITSQLRSLSNNLVATRLSQSQSDRTESNPNSSPFAPSPSPEIETILRSTIPLFSDLKSVNRKAWNNVEECKSLTKESRNGMDRARLGLENLMYEKRSLEREISACRDFESHYQDTPIHTLEEFVELASRSDPNVEVPSDPHQLMLARLKFEVAERQRLDKEKNALLSSKLKLIKENEEKKARLDELEKRLEDFVSNAKAIQDKMATF